MTLMKAFEFIDYDLPDGSVFFYASRFVPARVPDDGVDLEDIFLGSKECDGSYDFNYNAEIYQHLLLDSKYATAYRCWHYSIINQRKISPKEPLKTKDEEEREHLRRLADDRYLLYQTDHISAYQNSFLKGLRDGLTERAVELLKQGYSLALIQDITQFCIPKLKKLAEQHHIPLSSLNKDHSKD